MMDRPNLFAAAPNSASASEGRTAATRSGESSRVAPTMDGRPWWGLELNHRRMFDALQEDWLRPAAGSAGIPLAVGAHARDAGGDGGRHAIAVRLRLDPDSLPDIEVPVFRKGQWNRCRTREAKEIGDVIYWPAVLPTSSVRELLVADGEQRLRLVAMVGAVSNLDLPEEWVKDTDNGDSRVLDPPDAPGDAVSALAVPDDVDSIRGAMAMALWAVPRMDPWMELLAASLAPGGRNIVAAARTVEADWWRFPPWVPCGEAPEPACLSDRLWFAAVKFFRNREGARDLSPMDSTRRIAEAVRTGGGLSREDETALSEWLETARRTLRGDATLRSVSGKHPAVGEAILLVLVRPEPAAFETWIGDMPGLAPGVWFTAAALCGLGHGYRRLDRKFRGKAAQREILAAQVLLSCPESPMPRQRSGMYWPGITDRNARWRRSGNAFTLYWGDREICRWTGKARSRWWRADLENWRIRDAARSAAKRLGWSFPREVVLRKGERTFHGAVPQVIDGQMVVDGETCLQLRDGDVVRDSFSAEGFRRHVAVSPGVCPDPPAPDISVDRIEKLQVPGLVHVRDFLAEDEEEDLRREIDEAPWDENMRRRVQHYGWRYGYKNRGVTARDRLGRLPVWAEDLAGRLVAARLVPEKPDQVIVNEYVGDQAISKHTDSDSFADGIAMISLLETWEMWFRKARRTEKVWLDRRGVVVMTGESRYDWTHELRARKKEGRRIRKRRLSLTFRKVLQPGAGRP